METCTPSCWGIIVEILVRLALLAIYGWLELWASPFTRIIQPEDWSLYSYPHNKDTVEVWLLSVVAVAVPIISLVITATYNNRYISRKGLMLNNPGKSKPPRYTILSRKNFIFSDITDAFLSYTLAAIACGVITGIGKIMAGRPRPDFFNRCFPLIPIDDTVAVRNKVATLTNLTLVCDGDADLIKEGRKSFPSGHSSQAFCTFGFMAFYVWGKTLAYARKGQLSSWRFIAGWPLMCAALAVAISRTQDYRHHWEDVTVGSILGLVSAYLCYRLYYPKLRSCNSHLSYRQMKWVLESDRQKIVDDERWLDKIHHITSEIVPYKSKTRFRSPAKVSPTNVTTEMQGGYDNHARAVDDSV